MSIEINLNDVLPTQDGPWQCYDTVVTAYEINRLYKQGFLIVDYERQRGRDSMTDKPVLDGEKIERWAEELANGEAILGQLTWNFRKGKAGIVYSPAEKKLTIQYGEAHIPDSGHRHLAIVKAADSTERGSAFDMGRRFSLRIYNVSSEDEPRIFYAYNQEGKHADATRSKWLYPKELTQKLAAELVRRSPHLQGNVDTVRDRMSRKNPRLCAFNTLSKAFEDNWSEVDLTGHNLEQAVEWLLDYWNKLVQVLPQLGALDISKRTIQRKESLVDSAVAIQGYIALAGRMREAGVPLELLERLEESFFSRENPQWLELGILVPAVTKKGEKVVTIRNALQSRRAMVEAVLAKVGLADSAQQDVAQNIPV